MYHSFFIHSSVDIHLGCFHVIAVLNSATMNTGVHVSFPILVPKCICLGVSLLGHMVILVLVFLFFKGNSILSISTYITYTSNARGFSIPFLHTLFSIYCL